MEVKGLRYGLTLLFFHFIFLTFAQNKSVFFANASAKEVMEGTTFSVEFVMNDIRGSDFRPPIFNNFDVISGPNTTSSYQNLNGKVSQQVKYGFILRPLKPGRYTIGAATCMYNGQKLSTLPFEVTVKERTEEALKELGLPTDTDIFVRMELSKDTAYMGEKVELHYKLYTRKDVRSYDLQSEPEFAGFFIQNKPMRNRSTTQQEIDGVPYTVQILETKLLYPQQNGVFNFEPAKVQLGLPDPNRNMNSFFRSSLISYPTQTNEAKIVVVNLPDNAPASFTGAVGTFSLQAKVDKSEVSTDDAISLTMTVRGNGDPKYILAPSLDHLDGFDVYDPSTTYEDTHERFGDIETIKTFEYLIVPLEAGNRNLVPEFTYFDVDKNDYVTLKAGPFNIQVIQGKNTKGFRLSDQNTESRSLSGLMAVNNIQQNKRSPFLGITHLSFLGLFLGGLGWILFKKRKMDIEAGIDPSIKKRQKAKSVATKRLSAAKSAMEENNHRRFYDEIMKALLGFIADKLNVPPSEISKANVESRLNLKTVPDITIQSVSALLSQCELAVFAGKKDGNMQEVYEEAARLIESLNSII